MDNDQFDQICKEQAEHAEAVRAQADATTAMALARIEAERRRMASQPPLPLVPVKPDRPVDSLMIKTIALTYADGNFDLAAKWVSEIDFARFSHSQD